MCLQVWVSCIMRLWCLAPILKSRAGFQHAAGPREDPKQVVQTMAESGPKGSPMHRRPAANTKSAGVPLRRGAARAPGGRLARGGREADGRHAEGLRAARHVCGDLPDAEAAEGRAGEAPPASEELGAPLAALLAATEPPPVLGPAPAGRHSGNRADTEDTAGLSEQTPARRSGGDMYSPSEGRAPRRIASHRSLSLYRRSPQDREMYVWLCGITQMVAATDAEECHGEVHLVAPCRQDLFSSRGVPSDPHFLTTTSAFNTCKSSGKLQNLGPVLHERLLPPRHWTLRCLSNRRHCAVG